MMLIPEAWSGHESMSDEKKAFYEYHSIMMEPWDGPASVAFTDGRTIGAVLDRNGLRPSRYYVTRDDMVIMASEVGVLPVAPEDVLIKGRLEPGKMFLVNIDEGRIIDDTELKGRYSSALPYRSWLDEHVITEDHLPDAIATEPLTGESLLNRQIAFGYTVEDQKYILGPMGDRGEESLGSMGTDTPLAVLSDRPQPLYNYFKQLFAQVTNPPLDAIREEIVTGVQTLIGPKPNLLDQALATTRSISLESPFIGNETMARLKSLNEEGLQTVTLDILFPASEGPSGLEPAMNRLYAAADRAIEDGARIIVLSDRGVTDELAPIPSLLAVAGLHNHLVRERRRTHVGFVLETGDAREVHHFALLIGYGAGAINPYLAIDSLEEMVRDGLVPGDITPDEATAHYLKAIKKGVVKVMSKMGISTIQSYRGAQIFEAIGLGEELLASAALASTRWPWRRSHTTAERIRRPVVGSKSSNGVANTSGDGAVSSTCSIPIPFSGFSTQPAPAAKRSSANTRNW